MSTVASLRTKDEWQDDYETWTSKLLPVGTRVRHVQHPEVTGYIARYEWNTRELISPIPYCVYWDDGQLAHDLLGFLSIYPHPDSIEAADGGIGA